MADQIPSRAVPTSTTSEADHHLPSVHGDAMGAASVLPDPRDGLDVSAVLAST